jgi:hypothetical protein
MQLAESIFFGNRTVTFGLGEDAPHLFVIGDSQACGVTGCGSDPTKPCTKDTSLNGTPARVYCKVGAHTSEFTAVVPTLGLEKGDTVVIFLGSNDYDSKPDPAPIVRAIEAAGASYLWVGPPAIRGKDGAAPAHLQAMLGNNYFDSRALNLQLRDGIHPTASEFARWRAAVLAEVANRLQGASPTAASSLLATLRRPAVLAMAVLGVASVGGGIYYLATRLAHPTRLPAAAGEARNRACYRMHGVDGDETDLSYAEFLDANRDLPSADLRAIRALKPGETFFGGGGAAPEWWIQRLPARRGA